jgi:hypothetical protein
VINLNLTDLMSNGVMIVALAAFAATSLLVVLCSFCENCCCHTHAQSQPATPEQYEAIQQASVEVFLRAA